MRTRQELERAVKRIDRDMAEVAACTCGMDHRDHVRYMCFMREALLWALGEDRRGLAQILGQPLPEEVN